MIKVQAWRPAIVALFLGIQSATAFADTQSFLEFQAGLGYSTNPLLTLADDGGSAFGRVSAYGFLGETTERSASSLSAYVENNSYFSRYSDRQAFSVSASTMRQTTEALRLSADIGFSGDYGGQLSSRFFGVPSGSVVTDTNFLPINSSVILVDPTLVSLSQRQYRLNGRVGANLKLSPKSSLSGSLGAQRVFLSSGLRDLNYSQFDGTVSYDHQVNERTTLGGRVIGQYADYSAGRSVSSFGPQATIQTRFGPGWEASAALGFVLTHQDRGSLGSDSSIDLALDGSLCRNDKYDRLCARVSRRTQSTVVGGAPTSTSASIEFYRRLSAKDQIQVSASAVKSGVLRELGLNQGSSFYSVAASYDRQVNPRLSAGVNASARKLSTIGPDPKSDIGGSVFLRYRFGDLR